MIEVFFLKMSYFVSIIGVKRMKQVCFPYEQRLQCCYGRGHAEMQMVTGTVKHRLLSFKKIKSNFQFPTLKY